MSSKGGDDVTKTQIRDDIDKCGIFGPMWNKLTPKYYSLGDATADNQGQLISRHFFSNLFCAVFVTSFICIICSVSPKKVVFMWVRSSGLIAPMLKECYSINQ